MKLLIPTIVAIFCSLLASTPTSFVSSAVTASTGGSAPAYIQYDNVTTMTYSVDSHLKTVKAHELFSEAMTITDSDRWIGGDNADIISLPNEYTSVSLNLDSGELYQGTDSNNNPVPNPSKEHLGAGSNKYTFTIEARANSTGVNIIKTDTLTAHDDFGALPPAGNTVLDPDGSPVGVTVTITPP